MPSIYFENFILEVIIMRLFEFAERFDEEKGCRVQAYEDARMPEYATLNSAGADFFCAEEVTIPPFGETFAPTLVHTGIRACMEDGEWLMLANRSGNPKKGLVLANGLGIIDQDYYKCENNDGEIMFAFINTTREPITIEVGAKLGQGVFTTFARPDNAVVVQQNRVGGFGSTTFDTTK